MRFLLYFLPTIFLLSKVYAQSKEDFFALEKKVKETKDAILRTDIFLQLAQLWLEVDANKAEEYATQARKISQKNDLPTQTAHMTLVWGQIHRVQLKYKEAQQNLELAYQLFKRRQDKSNTYKALEELALFNSDKGYNKRADSLFSIVHSYCKQEASEEILLALNTFHIGIHLLRQGKFTKAIHQLEQVLDLYEKQGNYFMQGKTQNAIGLCYKNLSFQRLALEHYVQALKLYEKMGFSHKNMATTLINIGNIYVDWNDKSQFTIAEKYYLQAKLLAEEQKDALKHIASLNALARLRKMERKYEQALAYLDTANTVAIKNQVYLETGKIKYQRADIYRLLQQYKKSEIELEQALELYKSNESNKDKLYAKVFLGHLYKEKGNYITALHHYQAYLQIAKEGNFYLEAGDAYYHLAAIHLLLNECEKAMDYAQMSIKHGEHYASQQHKRDGFLYAAKADSCRGNYKQAFYWFTRYNNFKDSLTHTKRYQETQEIQALYDYEAHKKESELLKQKNITQQRYLEYQSITLFLGTLILIVVVILAFTLGYFYKYQKIKNKQIKKQNKNLEEANNFKGKLITIIAHDLRRPYANLIGTLQLIRSGDLDTEEQHLLFEQIEKQSVQTNEFIHKLLLWAKSQTEGFKFNPIIFDANVVINSVVQVLIQDAERKQIQISADIKPETYIFADIEMLNIIVFNLISNAIKFTPQAGKVRIHAQTLENIVMLFIEDNGIGISPENQAKLLQAKNFYTSGTAGESGFGLGLMICQDFISRNQGKFAFQSEVGKGSTFTIYLPNQPKAN